VAYREFDAAGAGWRDYTWQAMAQRVEATRGALVGAGLKPADRVAIALPNGTDWVATDIAALSLGLVVVPVYLHDSAANIAFILAHSGARLLVVDSDARWQALSPHASDLVSLERVWIRDTAVTVVEMPPRIRIEPLAEALAGPCPEMPATAAAPDALATTVYTSGTTGRPKGVMLTHHAIVWNAAMTAQVVPPRLDDRFLSCLPWPTPSSGPSAITCRCWAAHELCMPARSNH